MIRSMTAFSRKERTGEWGTLIWELRSVNHRYLEISPRLPEQLRDLENPLRDKLRKRLSRGKIECTLKLKTEHVAPASISINQAYLQQVIAAAHQIQDITKDNSTLPTLGLLNMPGIVATTETDTSILKQQALAAFDEALEDFIAHREREGSDMRQVIEDRLGQISEHTRAAKEKLPQLLQKQRERLIQKLEEVSANLDQDRLEQEMVYAAQKADIDEELDRLKSHVDEVYRVLKKGGACGRRLDFLMQELNREANTLGSKSIDTFTTQTAVELKVLIEQMREQIQNIE